ncbi:hypothetical protein CYMTET_26032 [Cymbomonas tetramitiformis]|uniref:Uncharacterized protein n=1 Tax=Cymbomonas tetramitiformis TaxID=36881 RepID=A0AAE0FT86_9CHLO|nr:hypothetical protein CYMTET_26032 [Cymbomonas tetramitiformis]
MKYYTTTKRAFGNDVLIGESPGPGTGREIWKSAEVLVWFLERMFGSGGKLLGRRVVEVGCGCAFAGLSIAKQGEVKDVMLTDIADDVIELAKISVELNSCQEICRVRKLAWGTSVDSLDGPFDLVVASDVLYYPHLFSELLVTLRGLCHANSAILLAYEKRTMHEINFFKLAAKHFACINQKIHGVGRAVDTVAESFAVYLMRPNSGADVRAHPSCTLGGMMSAPSKPFAATCELPRPASASVPPVAKSKPPVDLLASVHKAASCKPKPRPVSSDLEVATEQVGCSGMIAWEGAGPADHSETTACEDTNQESSEGMTALENTARVGTSEKVHCEGSDTKKSNLRSILNDKQVNSEAQILGSQQPLENRHGSTRLKDVAATGSLQDSDAKLRTPASAWRSAPHATKEVIRSKHVPKTPHLGLSSSRYAVSPIGRHGTLESTAIKPKISRPWSSLGYTRTNRCTGQDIVLSNTPGSSPRSSQPLFSSSQHYDDFVMACSSSQSAYWWHWHYSGSWQLVTNCATS